MLQSIPKSWYTGFQTIQKSSFMLDSKHSIFFLFMIGWHHNPHGISHSAIFEFSSYPFQRPRKIKIDTIDLDITRDQGGRGGDSPRILLPCTEVGGYRSFSAANCLSMSSSVTRDFDVSPRPLLGAAGACTICNEINGFLDMYSKLRSGYSYFDIIYTCIVFSFFLYCIFCKIIVHVKM